MGNRTEISPSGVYRLFKRPRDLDRVELETEETDWTVEIDQGHKQTKRKGQRDKRRRPHESYYITESQKKARGPGFGEGEDRGQY